MIAMTKILNELYTHNHISTRIGVLYFEKRILESESHERNND